jgi:site-specific DNA-methyltransferase (adenine-specific)
MDKLIDDGIIIDAIITDPPYGTTACKWDTVIPFEAMWERLNKLIKPNGAIVLFGSEPFSSALRMSNIKNYKYDWIWEKERGTGFARVNKQPMRKHEIISVFYKKQPYYVSQGEKLKKPYYHVLPISKSKSESDNVHGSGLDSNGKRIKKLYTHASKHSIIKIPRESNSNKLHPTQKPTALMEYLVKTYTNKGDTVLDFTMGSGTTGVAYKNLNRDFIGVEKDEKYFKIAKERINVDW